MIHIFCPSLGTKHSELIQKQQEEKSHEEKYFDACAFWVDCERSVLSERLAKRYYNCLVKKFI